MFTIAPELRPYSALYVELSTLNSDTVLIDPVDQKIDSILAIAGGVERKRSLAAQWCRQEAILWWRNRARDQKGQIHEVPAVQRNLLDYLLVDHLAYAHRCGLDDRLRAFHRDDRV